MNELVVVLKGGNKQKNVKGAVLADKAAPPFAARRDGYRLRWSGVDHPASVRIRALIEIEEGDVPLNGTCPYVDHCEMRRRLLPTYREHQPCHWLAFALGGDSWQCCPIFRKNTLTEKVV